MDMTCVYGYRECVGCMACQEPKEIIKSDNGVPIYEGDTYYDFDGFIIAEEELEQFRKVAGEDG